MARLEIKSLLRLIQQAIHEDISIVEIVYKSEFPIRENCFLCCVTTHNDIHIIIDGFQFLVGITKAAWEVILSIFHGWKQSLACKDSYFIGDENRKKKKKKKKKKQQQKNQKKKKKPKKQQILYFPAIQALEGFSFGSWPK